MSRRNSALAAAIILLLIAATSQARAEPTHAFSLPTSTGETVSIAPCDAPATVVWFIGAECPMARLYAPAMLRLHDEFTSQGVRFIAIDSNSQDSMVDLREYVQSQRISFPAVRDERNIIANRYGATRTTEVYLLDSDLRVHYQGRINDQYEPGVNRSAPSRDDLRLAITEVLAGDSVTVKQTKPQGCLIGKVPMDDATVVENDITFTNQVSRVLQRHCVECHREGEIAPFAMQEYEEVAGWAETMLETIDDGRMPPWGADPQHGKFANARHMPAADRQILRDWIAGGLKQGDPDDLPPAKHYLTGWQLSRPPDVVFSMRDRPYHVPAEGTVEYQYFVVDTDLEEDRWVAGAQIMPGNAAVVHHAIAFIRPPDGVAMPGIGWLTAYVPGQRLVPLPTGHARKLPAGSKIVFQMHYTTNGREQEDTTQVGIVFAEDEEVTHRVMTLVGIDQEFEIPPHAAEHRVDATVRWFPKDGRLLGVAPHMHYRGKSFTVFADRGDDTETLLHVPRYDFNWQHSYEFAEPLALDDVDKLHFTATFDNSAKNPFNPDPSQWVTWGDQTWEEMAVAFFEVAEPLEEKPTEPATARKQNDAKPVETPPDPARQKQIDAYIKQVFQKLDDNQDGTIVKDETPIVVRRFGFWQFDHDGDGTATREEVRKVAEHIYR